MAARSIWNGTITFGMVNVPVKLFTATDSKTVHFHEVHLRDGSRIEHRKICPKHDKVVPNDQIEKGFEVSEDEYVVLEDDEVKAAAGDRGKIVEISEFVEVAAIDPIFFEKTYYVGSRDTKEPYALLLAALERSERAGIGRFTFHDREYLVAVRALDGAIALHTLRFHDEVVTKKDLELPKGGRKPEGKEVKMAKRLVEMMQTEFKPGDYEDTYRAAVEDLIKRKAKGKEIDLQAEEEPAHGDDLAAALEASLGSKD